MKMFNARSGNILLLTTLVTVGVMSMVVGLASRFQAGFTLSEIDLAKQRARAASEAVASMMEARLTDIVATNDLANLPATLIAVSRMIRGRVLSGLVIVSCAGG